MDDSVKIEMTIFICWRYIVGTTGYGVADRKLNVSSDVKTVGSFKTFD